MMQMLKVNTHGDIMYEFFLWMVHCPKFILIQILVIFSLRPPKWQYRFQMQRATERVKQ